MPDFDKVRREKAAEYFTYSSISYQVTLAKDVR
ncbi:MAG: hypothetical protein K0R73_113 [Candidatus Midichloriaceae bacterium]|jgi:hypothetical protein|nr:hypothetical protein [Candidatus Midichloriaceae bacterium]